MTDLQKKDLFNLKDSKNKDQCNSIIDDYEDYTDLDYEDSDILPEYDYFGIDD